MHAMVSLSAFGNKVLGWGWVRRKSYSLAVGVWIGVCLYLHLLVPRRTLMAIIERNNVERTEHEVKRRTAYAL